MKTHCEKKIRVILVQFALLSGFIVAANAQISIKLPATNIIGTTYSVDYGTGNPSTTVNPKANAFDGKLNTYFASYDRSGTWVGLDLGERHIITKIAYSPRQDYVEGPQRLLLGVFEGANNPDFGDAVPLLLITKAPPMNVLTSQNINCSKGFRYVRYVGPNDVRCNIAEIEFWGYKGIGDNSILPQLTNLPTVTIHTTNAQDITNKVTYVKGIVNIINNGTVYSDSLEIRGRGHASWGFPKKPYKIKLKNKVNLFGLPSRERDWVLINNYGDKTLMRNLLAFDLSKRMDMAYTTAGFPVDLILNGEYKGCYQLCEHIEVAPGRVDIQQMNISDILLPYVSGGYVLEVDAYAGSEPADVWFSSSRYNIPVKIRYPDSDKIAYQQYNYIRNHFVYFEDAVAYENYKDPVNGYRRFLDVESFIRHFLVGEISGNTDTYWSTYMYKDRNNNAFIFGPVWDFDIAYENDNRTFPINSRSQWVFEFGSVARGFRNIINRLLTDETLVMRLKAVYSDYRDRGIISKEALLNVVDNYASELNQSQQLNFMRWKNLNSIVHQNPQVYGSYEGEVNNVKRYISERIDWMDKKLNYVPSGLSVIHSFSEITVYTLANEICFNNITETVNTTIADISGRIIHSKPIQDNASFTVPKGSYIVTVTDAKWNRKTVKCLVW